MFDEESFSKRRIASVYKLVAKLNKRQLSAVLEAGDSSHGPNEGCITFFIASPATVRTFKAVRSIPKAGPVPREAHA